MATNVDIVVYALATLGGAERTVYSEDIAAKCYELAPSHFSWRLPACREKGWPDKYIVKTALEDAKKEEYDARVEGSYALETAKDGWHLTPRGVKWLRQNQEKIEKELGLERPAIPKKDVERFMKQLRAQPLFKRFLKTKTLVGSTRYDFTDMLTCSPDAPRDVIIMKFQRLRAMAELVKNTEVTEFLSACASAFPVLIPEQVKSKESEEGD